MLRVFGDARSAIEPAKPTVSDDGSLSERPGREKEVGSDQIRAEVG